MGKLKRLRHGVNMRSAMALFDRLARPRFLGLLFALVVLILGGVNGFDFPLSAPFMVRTTGCNYLDMCAFCSAPQIYSRLEAFGPAGRHSQLLLSTTIDVVIPVVFGLFGAAALKSLGRGSPKCLVFVPMVAATLDLAENAEISALVLRYPEHRDTLAGLMGFTSGAKFCAYGLTLALILLLAVSRVASWVTRR